MQAWPYYAYYPCAAHRFISVFFHILKDLTIPRRGREGRSGISKRQHPWLRMERRGKKKRKPTGRWGWWKIKPMLVRLPVAREVSLSFSEAWRMEDKGWAKEMLCLSLHGLLIYLCPILGNPCSRRLEAKASNQAVCPKRIHYFR